MINSIYWESSLTINDKLHDIVFNKFKERLLQFCAEEKVKIVNYNTIEDLNLKCLNRLDKNNFAVGVYQYYTRIDSNKLCYDEKYPSINILQENSDKYDTLTLAHELGHHLAIKNFYDNGEGIANHFILLLVEELLTNIEVYIISISLRVYSKINFPLPEITKKDWKNFKKEHNL